MHGEWEGTLESVREPQGLSTRWIAAVAVGTAIFLAASLALLWVFYEVQGKAGPRQPPMIFPGPTLQSDPIADLRAWEAAQKAQLDRYAWVDREHGIIQVPIERAMEIVAGRGDKAYEPPAGIGQ